MSSEQARYSLEKLKRRYIVLRLVEIISLGTATGLLTKALANLFVPSSTTMILLSVVAGTLVAFLRIRHYRLLNLKTDFFTSYLNKNYPQLKESADLLVRSDDELTSLQQLQKAQTLRQFNSIYPEIKLPQNLVQSFGILVGCGIAHFLLSSFVATPKPLVTEKALRGDNVVVNETKTDTTTASLRKVSINIAPPAYTQLKAFTATSNNLLFPEGSAVTWNIDFTNTVSGAKIIFSGHDSLSLTSKDKSFGITKTIFESGFYQLQWTFRNKIHRSDYYKIEVIKDETPKTDVTNLDQFTRLRFNDNLRVSVNTSLADDYGLSDAHIIATVSKGSGESVKFREEKLSFTSPSRIAGRQLQASLVLDLPKLGLEPGDELYFYVVAFDNKTPQHNRSRTETFFIALQDTTAEVTTLDEGLGVDLLPEYFRSQRQIIIDTEKLLKDKKRITKKEFNSTSNELGYDQKVLRLRYGQFMGEEGDSGIGHEAAASAREESEHEKDEKDIMKEFGHAHDTENEHNLVGPTKESHDHGTKDPDEKQDPLKDFIHQHDDSEEATFLFQSVKAKLKAALSLMWDSELQLRLFEPEKSLPYQYQALKLLKEISNDSRIYVHRSGFDPPPLKEEKRLTADLTEIKTTTGKYANESAEKYPNIRKALLLTEKMSQQDSVTISADEQRTLNMAGQELSTEAIEQPGLYLKGLSQLRLLADQQVKPVDMKRVLSEVRAVLWKVIPVRATSPTTRPAATHKLDQKFLQILEDGMND